MYIATTKQHLARIIGSVVTLTAMQCASASPVVDAFSIQRLQPSQTVPEKLVDAFSFDANYVVDALRLLADTHEFELVISPEFSSAKPKKYQAKPIFINSQKLAQVIESLAKDFNFKYSFVNNKLFIQSQDDKKEVALAGAGVELPVSQQVNKPRWVLLAEDKNLSTIIQKWAETQGYQFNWDTPQDVNIKKDVAIMAADMMEAVYFVVSKANANGYSLAVLVNHKNKTLRIK